jgi:glycerol-3-phosphate dehydrogenase subunit C
MGTMATMVAPIVNYVTNIPLTRFFLDKIVGIPAWRIFPKYSWTTFRAWYFNNRPDQTQFAEQVTLFHGCFINFNNPSLGQDSIRLLNALGVGVRLLARERCCGVPLISSGFFGHAKDNALSNAKNIAQALTKTERVVCPSSTCSMTLRNEYPDILEVKNDSWRDRMDLLIRHVYRLMEKGRELNFQRQEIKVAYHTACHMEKLGWSAYSIKLLKLIPGLQLTILPSRCCGIAGTYGFKKENSEYSQKIGAPLFQSIRDSGCDLVVSECETCKMQIQMSTGVPCENPVTILARNLV